ncbi:UDP-N-acetylglucosamine pyrophosphorylase [Nostoc linckia NIES-25]|nr:UDP-N-acetylglucosamine pyrophosphorylase [Nostoc linckia NIES-25]
MKVFVLRLKPHDDLKQSLNNFVIQEDIKAGFILSAIGSLQKAKIRFANQVISTVLTEKFEIIALNGTIATTGVHLHIAVSD